MSSIDRASAIRSYFEFPGGSKTPLCGDTFSNIDLAVYDTSLGLFVDVGDEERSIYDGAYFVTRVFVGFRSTRMKMLSLVRVLSFFLQ